MLEVSENLEENLLGYLEELEEELEDKGSSVQEELKKIDKAAAPTLMNVLDKMKILSPRTEKKVKKFFFKENRLVEKS